MVEFLNIGEVAKLLGLHEITIRRCIKRGDLKAVRVGRGVRVRKEDLEDFIKPITSGKEPRHSVRDMERVLKASYKIDQLRESLKTRVKDWDSTAIIREWRDRGY